MKDSVLYPMAGAVPREKGMDAIGFYTNEKMTANIAFERRLGYVETERRA